VLEGILPILSPELFAVLVAMGHGDELVIADGNFPSASLAERLIRAGGHGVPPLLDAVLQFFPLDRFVLRAVHANIILKKGLVTSGPTEKP
jgi:L-fucose mutarotase